MITTSHSPVSDTLSDEEISNLYKTQGREIWAIFYARCSDHAVADDVLSESFTRLLAHHGGSIKNPRAWLIHVGKNLLVDHVRRGQRLQAQATSGDLLTLQPAPDQDLLLREVRDLVRDSLRDLCADYRMVLVLRYGLGYSTKCISEVMGNTPAAADMQLSRARRKLAVALNSRGVNNASDLWLASCESHGARIAGNAAPDHSPGRISSTPASA